MQINLEKFNQPCPCGRPHSVVLKSLLIERGAVNKLPQVIQECELTGKPLIICDKNTYEAAGRRVQALVPDSNIVILDPEGLHPDEKAVADATTAFADSSYVISVGSGTINDLSKYVAHEQKVPYVAVATAASVDGYVSTVAAMSFGSFKVTAIIEAPIALIADTEICKNAPYRLTASGVGDILGKYTALADWKMSHVISGEYLCQRIYDMEMEVVEKVAGSLDAIRAGSDEAYEDLMYALVVSGLVMQMMGNSRPASASEHHMSHFWELNVINKSHNGLHGEMVSVGMVQSAALTRKIIDKIGGSIKDYVKPYEGMPHDLLKQYFKDMYAAVIKESTPDDMLNVTVDSVVNNWDQVVEIYQAMPSAEKLTEMLKKIDAPYTMEMVGLDPAILPLSIRLAPFVRGRITMMRLYDTMLTVEVE